MGADLADFADKLGNILKFTGFNTNMIAALRASSGSLGLQRDQFGHIKSGIRMLYLFELLPTPPINKLVSFWCLLLVNLEEWLGARCGTSSAIAFEGRATLG